MLVSFIRQDNPDDFSRGEKKPFTNNREGFF
jgi:hypothetical protein